MMKKNKILISILALVITFIIGCNNVFALKTYSVGQLYTRNAGAYKSIYLNNMRLKNAF